MPNPKTLIAVAAAAFMLAGAGMWAPPAAASQRGTINKAPRLNEPHETVVLSADGAPVRFRWTSVSMRGEAHLHDQFRVFKGNQAYADAMIHEQKVLPGQGGADVSAALLKEPGVYCWTVRQIGSRDKSREAFSVFKVS